MQFNRNMSVGTSANASPDSQRGPILITGANGFVGRALATVLGDRNIPFRRALRYEATPMTSSVVVGEVGPQTDWQPALGGIDAVIHLAGRVHMMQELLLDPLAEYRKVNVAGTQRLAAQARDAGVRRLVYVSSVKVNGDHTVQPFTETDLPVASNDPYGRSKLEAEQALLDLHAAGTFEVVIVRPTLVYGPGVKANFLQLVRLVDRGWPLPFGRINNKRSLIAASNLCDLLLRCTEHPNAAGEIFFASDDHDLSTTELVTKIAQQLGRSVLLVPVPKVAIELAGRLFDKSAQIDRLWGTLQVSVEKAKTRLDWHPPYTVDTALAELIAWYRNLHSKT